MKVKWLGLFCLVSVSAAAQDGETVRAALYLTGADTPEALDERLLEELEGYRDRPLRINQVSRARLLESGLLTPYQVATLEEYRSVSGDILSFRELERVDGFGTEMVSALRPFLSLASDRAPGAAVTDSLRFRHSALLRYVSGRPAGKYRMSAGRFEGAAALKEGGGTAYALWRTRHGKLLVGDYHLRYGQGLAFWTAFQLSGLATPSAFSKRAGGITPSWSFTGTGTLRGLVWEGMYGSFQGAVFGALDGTLGGHVGWWGKRGQAGLTISQGKVSLDGKMGYRGVDLYGEIALKGREPAGLAGLRVPFGTMEAVFQIRGIPSGYSGKKQGEYAAALGWGFHSDDRTVTASWTVDGALLPLPQIDPGRFQVKSVAIASWQPSENWLLSPRFSARIRSDEADRFEIRADLAWSAGPWSVKGRVHGAFVEKMGGLAYLEGGWKPEGGFVWLRTTFFCTPDWPTRIYCYERDIPGVFTVPAYYGKGLSIMAYAGWKKRLRRTVLKLSLRGSGTWKKEKPGQAGLKFQLSLER